MKANYSAYYHFQEKGGSLMLSTAFLLVLGSGFLHSVWNLFTKRSLDKNVFLWLCQLVGIVLMVPWAIALWDGSQLNSNGWWIIAAASALHGLYTLLLAAAYSVGDLSQVYPIMRGTSPLLVPLIGVTLLNEQLTLAGYLGVACIVIGIVALSNIKLGGAGTSLRAPLLALAVGLCIASYIVVDKLALGYVPAIVLNTITTAGNLLALTPAVIRAKGMKRELRHNGKIMLLCGLIAPGGYLIFLYALSLGPVSLLAPMREIGTVFGTLMGILILHEKQGKQRIWSSVLITGGVIVLGLWG
ncbi:DMT family transporter [Paenibacillus lignilyticus]|uniref:EamA family transporter n=1 Tax=Paenibacillus lignilyticus TaxID=1172615 RepID=A0ABS5CFZ8_9BACL|nr:EamA family transporter [Paenibacillus lignilyticus]